MNQPPNLERRIKRQVWSQEHDFFAVCAPGLEELCAAELASLGIAQCQRESGGLGFRAPFNCAYTLHLQARLLGRLFLRLKSFRIHNLADFITKLNAIAWELYLPARANIKIKSDLGHSHLRHGPSLEGYLMQAIDQRLEAHGLAPALWGQSSGLRLLLRTHEGRCQISLDLSGEHLHKRGYRLASGPAPLRETLAAALLAFCGYQGQLPLLDPMCGSGTVALEAAQIALRMAPGINRGFALHGLACHRQALWGYLCGQARAQARAWLIHPITARDKAPLTAARQNARGLGVEASVTFEQADFWQAPAPQGPPGLVVINPPYGVRLGSVRGGARLAARLAGHLARFYRGWQVGILLYRPEWQGFFKLGQPSSLVCSHGGLRLTMLQGWQS